MFGSCPGGSFRYCQRAAHVPIGRPGEVQEGMGGASGSNLMVSLLVVRHSGGGPPTGRLQGDYASIRWAISSQGAPPPGTTFLPPPTARPPHPAQKGNLPRGDYTGATMGLLTLSALSSFEHHRPLKHAVSSGPLLRLTSTVRRGTTPRLCAPLLT